MSELFSGQDFSRLFECCNFFGVKTSCRNFSFATIFGSRPYDGSCVYGVPTDGSPKSDFEISYVSDSVVLELSVADFFVVDYFVWNSFLTDFLQPFCIFSHLRWLCTLMSLSFCMDFLHPFELLSFPAWSCVRS